MRKSAVRAFAFVAALAVGLAVAMPTYACGGKSMSDSEQQASAATRGE